MSISLHPRKGEDLVINGRWWRYLREIMEVLGRDVEIDSNDIHGEPTPYLTAGLTLEYADLVERYLGVLVEIRHLDESSGEIVRHEPGLDSPQLRRDHRQSNQAQLVPVVDDPEALAFVRQFIELLRNSSGMWIYDERVG